MNILDKAIGWLSPEAGARRARARVAMNLMRRSYEGAKTGRPTYGWITSGSSANAEIGPALAQLRARSRDLVRNNPYAARVVDIWAGNLVGTGIMPQSRTGDETVDATVDALWREWVEQCDASGAMDFYGLQTLATRTVIEGGEVLLRYRPRRANEGMTVPLQLQLLEGDYLDTSRDGQGTGTTQIIQGIEFDQIERRVAYWLWRQHPGDNAVSVKQRLESVRVPASEVLHVFRKLRQGQERGVPWMAPIMIRARDLDDFHEAALVRARMEACIAMVVTQSDGAEERPIGVPTDDRRVDGIEPGMVPYLRPGEEVEFLNPTASPSFDPFTLHTLMAMAVGTGVTYDQLTGDLRQANYSSLRAGKIEFRRLVEQHQYQMLIPMLCRPVWRRFIETAIVAGRLPDRPGGYPAEWTPPAHEPIDPLKDLKADIMAVRAGAMTLPQMIARWGYDPRQQLAEIAATNTAIDRLSIVLDTDPRRVTQAGGAQTKQEEDADA